MDWLDHRMMDAPVPIAQHGAQLAVRLADHAMGHCVVVFQGDFPGSIDGGKFALMEVACLLASSVYCRRSTGLS